LDLADAGSVVAAAADLHATDLPVAHGEDVEHAEEILPNLGVRVPFFDNG
jgi:hypothetical protein